MARRTNGLNRLRASSHAHSLIMMAAGLGLRGVAGRTGQKEPRFKFTSKELETVRALPKNDKKRAVRALINGYALREAGVL